MKTLPPDLIGKKVWVLERNKVLPQKVEGIMMLSNKDSFVTFTKRNTIFGFNFWTDWIHLSQVFLTREELIDSL